MKTSRRVWIAALAVLALPACLSAAFEDVETGARAAALGGAYVAQADDVSAIFYNPAALAGLTRPGLLASYEKLFLGLSDNSSLARSIVAVGAPVTVKGRFWGNAAFSWDTLALSGLYEEGRMRLGFASPVRGRLWLGIALSRLSVTYGSDEYTRVNPVFANGYQQSAMGIDLALFGSAGTLDYGLSLQNLNEPDLGLKYANKVDRKISAGVSLKQESSTWDLALVLVGRDTRLKMGAEVLPLKKLLKERVVARGGFGIGSRDYRNAALGFGYRDAGYRIDYAFVYPLSGIAETFGSHQLCFALDWGRPRGMSEKDEKRKEEDARRGTGQGLGGSIASSGQQGRGAGGEPLANAATGQLQIQVEETYHEITLEDRRRVRDLVNNARQQIDAGQYMAALDKFREADRILRIDQEIKNNLNRLVLIIDISSQFAGGDRKNDLLRKSVAKYMNNNRDAVLAASYAYQRWPDDPAVARVRDVIAKAFPETAANIRLLPGISIVDQMLQDALDLIRAGRFIQAVGTLEKVLELDPNNITALTRMGSAYWAMDKKDIAVKTWKKVLQLDPGNVEVKEFMKGSGSME